MARINLLPWREELNRQKQRQFAFMSGGSVVLAGLVVLLSHLHINGMIDNQNQRNTYLQGEINALNKRIGRIQEMEDMKHDLLARMNVIQELQSSRPESVHLMDELVRTLPDGVYLSSLAQKKRGLVMKGTAQSNARVSDYMRNIENSDWLGSPRLDLIQSKESKRRRVANFTMRGKQKARKTPDNGKAG